MVNFEAKSKNLDNCLKTFVTVVVVVMELRKCFSDQTVPYVQHGYALGTPFDEPFEWTANLHGHTGGGLIMKDMDPHYAYFGCNTESQVMI